MIGLVRLVVTLFVFGFVFTPNVLWAKGGFSYEATFETDSNVYNVKDKRKDDIDNPSAAEKISGRYDDMESSDDRVMTQTFTFSSSGKGSDGGKVYFNGGLKYDFYFSNTEYSYATMFMDLSKKTSSGNTFGLDLKYSPDRFKKNYIAGAPSAGDPDNVQSDERVYEQGVVSDLKALLYFKTEMSKEVDMLFGLGYLTKAYDEPFSGRDRDGFFVPVEVGYKVNKDFSLGFNYEFESVTNDVHKEFVLIEEDVYGVDINGDGGFGGAGQLSIAEVDVDRSYESHTFGLSGSVKIQKNMRLKVGYEIMDKSYSSDEEYNEGHKDRNDERKTTYVKLTYNDFGVGIKRVSQDADKGSDLTGADSTSYDKELFWVSYGWKF